MVRGQSPVTQSPDPVMLALGPKTQHSCCSKPTGLLAHICHELQVVEGPTTLLEGHTASEEKAPDSPRCHSPQVQMVILSPCCPCMWLAGKFVRWMQSAVLVCVSKDCVGGTAASMLYLFYADPRQSPENGIESPWGMQAEFSAPRPQHSSLPIYQPRSFYQAFWILAEPMILSQEGLGGGCLKSPSVTDGSQRLPRGHKLGSPAALVWD